MVNPAVSYKKLLFRQSKMGSLGTLLKKFHTYFVRFKKHLRCCSYNSVAKPTSDNPYVPDSNPSCSVNKYSASNLLKEYLFTLGLTAQ